MGTEILRPQDCLIERMRVGPPVFSRRRSYAAAPRNNPNPSPSPNPNQKNLRKQQLVKSDQKKRFHQSETTTVKNNGNIVMGHVTILKRGESLDALKRNETSPKKKIVSKDLIVVGTERLGPDPELVPRQIRITDLKLMSSSPPPLLPSSCRSDDHVYAGSAFAMSPSPSSLPLPSFYKKKEDVAAAVVVVDSATKDLRRLLRLDA